MTSANFNKAIKTINTASSPTRSLAVLLMMIPTVFTASKGLEIFYSDIYCEYFRPLDRIKQVKHNFVAALKKHKFVCFCFSLAHCGSSFIITKMLGAPNIITIHVLFLEASVQTEKGRRRIGGKENRKGISIFLVFCT